MLKSIPLRSNRFGFEPEITIKIAKRQARVYEMPISYNGRTYEEGKKIGLKDAFEAFWVMLKTLRFRATFISRQRQRHPGCLLGAPNFNRWMADTIRPYIVKKRVLEIGAGMGNLTRALARGRQRYIASDIDHEHLSRLQARLRHYLNVETRTCDLSKSADFVPLADAVDTVICLNVLEHIEDDLGALRNIYSALSPGGRAIVLVPCGQEIFGQLDVILGHYRRYSTSQLRERFEQTGFEIERILEFNHISRPSWYFTGKIAKRSRISRSQLKIFDQLVWLWRRIDRFIPWKPTSLIAIAAKPQLSSSNRQSSVDVGVALGS